MIDNAMNTLIRVRSSRKEIVYNCGAPYLTYRIVVVNYWFKDPTGSCIYSPSLGID
jgi:hypothetical protein